MDNLQLKNVLLEQGAVYVSDLSKVIEKDGRLKDGRSRHVYRNGADVWYVHPVAQNMSGQCYIVCPHCGHIHVHKNTTGLRNAHCSGDNANGMRLNYYIIT